MTDLAYTTVTFLGIIPEYCALFILLILMYINRRKANIMVAKNEREKLVNADFIRCEIATLALIVIDLIRYSNISPSVEYVSAILFHCSIVMMANCITSYIYDMLPMLKESSKKFYNVKNKVSVAIIVLICLISPTGMIYSLQDDKVVIGPMYFISFLVGIGMFTICMYGAYKVHISNSIKYTMYLVILCTVIPCIFEILYIESITSGVGFVAGLLLLSSMFNNDGIYNMTHGAESFTSISKYLKLYKRFKIKILVFDIKSLSKNDHSDNVILTKNKILTKLKQKFDCETLFESNDRYALVLRNVEFDRIAEIWEAVTYRYIDEFICKSIVIDKEHLNEINLSILSSVQLHKHIVEFSAADKESLERKKKITRTIQSIVTKDEYNDDRLVTMIQPIIDLDVNKFLTGEMLTRLKVDGIDGVVNPYEFIPIVEELGCTHKFNLCVLNSACRLMRKIKLEKIEFDSISVNFDPSELALSSFTDDVMTIVDDNHISPTCIHIEVTESTEIDNVTKTNKCIDKLLNLGFSVYLDDFGTKYSNVAELLSTKFNVIKLDRQIILKALEDETAHKVVTALSSACSAVGYKVLFEGVDSDNGVDLARNNGASYIQGFYYSKPLSWKDFITFIKIHNAA